jgi:hypothetical protein
MFIRAALQGAVDERASLPHTVSVPSPYAMELRPHGFPDGVPNYRILVERAVFRLQATVLPDYLAVAIVAAVVSGARNNPARLERLKADLHEAGWRHDIQLSTEEFQIEATFESAVGVDEVELADRAVTVGVALSEFVLDQLLVTRPIGEMRAAVERPVGDQAPGEVWLYDPSERDRSTQVHRSLENWLIAKLRDSGIEPLDPAGEPYFDLAWRSENTLHVCEVKSSANNPVHQLRLGLGQILQYRHALSRAGREVVSGCILIEDDPAGSWVDLCSDLGILLFWPSRWDEVVDQLVSNRSSANGP